MTFHRSPVLATILLLASSWNNTAWAAESEGAADPTATTQSKYHDLDDNALLELRDAQLAKDSLSCEEKPLLSEMQKREAFASQAQADYILASVNCAIDNDDMKEAYRYVKQWELLEGFEPPEAAWALQIAYHSDARDDVLKRIADIAQFEEPDQLLKVTDTDIYHIIREFRSDDMQNEVTLIYNILLQSPHFAELHSNLRSITARYILGEHLKSGNPDIAAELLPHITVPTYYDEMLASRKYEPIWTQVEQRVGPNMEIIFRDYLHSQSEAYQADSTNKEAKQRYGRALYYAGQYEDVIALAQSIDHSAEAVPTWEEDDAWLLNFEAYAHDVLDNTTESDRIFDSFATIPNLANEKIWLTNFLLNRAGRLVNLGRWEEGLTATIIASGITNDSGTPYAKMLVRSNKVCALYNLGRTEDALAMVEEIEVHLKDSLREAINALLCVGNRERAAEIMVKGMADEEESPALIAALQKTKSNQDNSNSGPPTIYDELHSHPQVSEAFNRIARLIPDQYIPLSYQLEEK